jgi:hypothetical protein
MTVSSGGKTFLFAIEPDIAASGDLQLIGDALDGGFPSALEWEFVAEANPVIRFKVIHDKTQGIDPSSERTRTQTSHVGPAVRHTAIIACSKINATRCLGVYMIRK